jgi:hypothetical protein
VLLRGPLTASGDADAVAAAIAANPTPLRLSIAADAIMAMSDAALAVLLFFILRDLRDRPRAGRDGVPADAGRGHRGEPPVAAGRAAPRVFGHALP